MLKELFDAVVAQARESLRPQVLNVPGEADHFKRVAMPNGTIATFVATPKPRDHAAFSLETMVDMLGTAHKPAIWYSRAGVTGFFDDEDRRDKVAMGLTPTQQMTRLELLARERAPWDHKSFVNLLRITFAGCLGLHPTFLPSVRTVKFRGANSTDADVQVGKASVGKAIMAELYGYDRLPEEVNLDVPLVEQFGLRYTITCALDIEPVGEKFFLIPLPGTIDAAYRRLEDFLYQQLAEIVDSQTIPLYYGKP